MSLRSAGLLAPDSDHPDFEVSLRVRHPHLDPDVLTQTLGVTPAYSWKAGEPRRSQAGAPLGGHYRESYWSAPLRAPNLRGQSMSAAQPPLESFLALQLLQLSRHRDFFKRLQAEGGEISLLLEMSPIPNLSLTLNPTLARRIADLNLEVELQLTGE